MWKIPGSADAGLSDKEAAPRPAQAPAGKRPDGAATPVEQPPGEAIPPAEASPLAPDSLDAEVLYEQFQPLVLRLIHQFGDDPELRQELEGEIYCRFRQLLAAYDPARGVPVRAYLVRSLPPTVYSFVRSRWRHRERERSVESLLGTDGEHAHYLAGEDPTPQYIEALSLQKVLEALPAALAQLTERQRNIVIWRYYEGRSFEEIAADLEVAPATIRSLLRHGINGLRRQICPPENAG